MAMFVRMMPGDELRGARVGSLVSWLLIGASILVGARFTQFPSLWYAALFVTLAFPHAVSSAALILTEGPALLFATLGTLLWVEFLSQPIMNISKGLGALLGGILIGFAITCRQYYLALLPAGLIWDLNQFRQRSSRTRSAWFLTTVLSLIAATIPMLILMTVWHGLSSPSMASGSSYTNWKSNIGMNFYRPIVTLLYIALYSVPLTFPAMRQLPPQLRMRVLIIASFFGLGAAHFASNLIQPGPFNSFISILSRTPKIQLALFSLIVGVTVYNFLAVVWLCWDRRTFILSCPPALFAVLTIVFFIAEQAGVQGNVPFYDRYVIQMAPFLGISAFALLPEFRLPRLLALTTSSLLGHVMLWRYAFG
jgi:hypothetical protein